MAENPFPYVREGAYKDDLQTIDSAAEIGALIAPAWTDWTPTLLAASSNPTLSDNASHLYEGRYLKLGSLVEFRGQVKAGDSGVAAGSGVYRIAAPVAAKVPANSASLGGWMVGRFSYFDASGLKNYGGGLAFGISGDAGTHFKMAFGDAAGTAAAALLVSHSNPFALSAGCEFELWGCYEAAA